MSIKAALLEFAELLIGFREINNLPQWETVTDCPENNKWVPKSEVLEKMYLPHEEENQEWSR